MYFNRKNAEQKNWRMIKKGKHFLFGCSLVFAVGAALVAPSVKADAVEAKPEASSTAEGVKPAAAEEKTTYAAPAVEVAPAAVVEEKVEKAVETTQNSKEEPVVAAPEITSDLSGKGSSATNVTVKAPAGSTVKLYNSDGVVIGQAVADAQGVATVTPINSLPVGEITATATSADGTESPKSAPVTATRAEKSEVDGGVSRGNDNTQLLVTRSHITVYPGESVNIGVEAASNEIENFWVPNNPDGVKGLLPTGTYIKTAGTDTIKHRPAGYGGTVDWTQSAGDTVVTFAVRSKKNAIVTRDLKVTVLELTKKLDAVAGEKVEVADPNNVSGDEKNKIIEATTKANSSFPPGTTYSVDEKGNLVITYPDKSTDKITAAYLVTPAAREADKYTPTAKGQTVAPGSTPDAKNSIDNAGELPSGTTFAYKIPVDTATEGEKDAIVVVTYPDKSTDEVPVKVTVKDPRSDADKNEPKAETKDPAITPVVSPSTKKAGAKELPNTGTEQSNASLGLALLVAATAGLLFAKKRKEEE